MGQNDHEESTGSDTGVKTTLSRHGGLSYLEIPAVDPRQSAAFYEKVLGWNVREQKTNEFRFADVTGHLIGR